VSEGTSLMDVQQRERCLSTGTIREVTPPPLPLPSLFMRFIGVIELAGALGLILPGLTRIGRRLKPLAALGLFLEMIGATVVTLLGGKGVAALLPVVVGLLCVPVAYGRRSSRATQSHHAERGSLVASSLERGKRI
jgi:uncharacterized membrane protein YphA (DoxX/SURF4 family)